MGRQVSQWVTAFVGLGMVLPALNLPLVCAAEKDHAAVFFAEKVLPILKQSCFECHGNGAHKGGLSLGSRASILAGGDSGPAASLTQAEASLLLQAVRYESFEMPPKGKLPADQIAILTEWVKLGVPFPSEFEQKSAPPPPRGLQVTAADKQWWAYQPLAQPAVPYASLQDRSWPTSPVDAFIAAKLQSSGIRPNEPASRAALIRRVTYDLIGLPPTPAEVAAFVADPDPLAYEKLVDRLLANPAYGEKWGRHWLDLVRYAETNSYERDDEKPFVWRYRDYVIDSLNADKPYDRFLLEQLAGDELPDATPETIIATGYYRLGIWDDEPADPELAIYDDLDDIVRTTSEVMLGMTLGCARCHDHKIDPVPQRDYYQVLAFFRNVRRYGTRSGESVAEASLVDIASPEERSAHADRVAAYQEAIKQIEGAMQAIERLVKPDFIPVEHEEWKHENRRVDLVRKRVGKTISAAQADEYDTLTRRLRDLRRQPPPALTRALAVTEHGPQPKKTHVLIRGNAGAHGEEVAPAFPEVLAAAVPELASPPPSARSTGRRTAFAQWVVSPTNPLTARVVANRLWHYHFGRGIVASTSNFGKNGDPPTHPELLDWLANELIRQDWHWKPIHRLLLTSQTYQLSSARQRDAADKDPDNNLYGRFQPRRLLAEEVRDTILAVTDQLNAAEFGGPSVYPIVPPEVLAGQSRPGAGWGNDPPSRRQRRSVYVHVKRSLQVPILESFDAADTDFSCPVRFVSTQPTQTLSMLNSDFLTRMSRAWADRLQQQFPDQPESQVRWALSRVTQRPPTQAEVNRAIELLNDLHITESLPPADALAAFCLVALNLNEFLYLD